MKKLALSLIIMSILLPTVVLAQSDQTAFLQAILTIFLGNPPNACLPDFATPLCVQCLGFLKLLPLAFFTVVFFFVFYLIMRNAGMARTSKEGGTAEISGTGSKVAALIAIILAIVFVHSVQGGLQTILLFLSLGFVFLALFLIASVTKGAVGIVVIVVGIIVIIALWGFFWNNFSDIVNTWQTMCG